MLSIKILSFALLYEYTGLLIDYLYWPNLVRSTTIPEELGRISYLLSDKTGTLTENVMIFKKLHLGTAAYGTETFDEIRNLLGQV